MPRRHLSPVAAPLLALIITGLASATARPDGAADNSVDQVRPIPPPGIAIPLDDRRRLAAGVAWLGAELELLRRDLAGKPALLARLPDIQILHKSVDWALRYNEFFATNEIRTAESQLREGFERANALREGRTPWLSRPGPVALGYLSDIDGSVQPYGIVIPPTYDPVRAHRYRLDFWFHGRGEKLTELAFIADRSTRLGEFAPSDTFVLHPYGRYCNGSRFAGETDAWEAFADLSRRFPIDENRLVVRGFSLGGASCWHFAVHHAWRWAAAAPGAGFSETAEFLRVFQNETLQPQWWEQNLWRLHDATAHAANLRMVPTVAYSGEVDRQIQAAQAVEKAARTEGFELTHLIGPGTGHSYHPETKVELERRIDALAARGRDPLPRSIHFVTHTLRYPRMAWVLVDGLEQHWAPARIDATLHPDRSLIVVTTTNVTAITLDLPPDPAPFDAIHPITVELDVCRLEAGSPRSDRSWRASFHRDPGSETWRIGPPAEAGLRKRPGLQGPIDDAFLGSFLFVRPTGQPWSPTVATWSSNELSRAIGEWRRHYRGEVRIKNDSDLTDADMAAHHLVLWGDPGSNGFLKRIADRLPIRWDASGIHTPVRDYAVDRFAPVLIHPNPLRPDKYVVLNSGFTFREYDYLNNARQTPKLPDWAVLDLSQPPDSRFAGGIGAAGFFGERWEWKAPEVGRLANP